MRSVSSAMTGQASSLDRRFLSAVALLWAERLRRGGSASSAKIFLQQH